MYARQKRAFEPPCVGGTAGKGGEADQLADWPRSLVIIVLSSFPFVSSASSVCTAVITMASEAASRQQPPQQPPAANKRKQSGKDDDAASNARDAGKQERDSRDDEGDDIVYIRTETKATKRQKVVKEAEKADSAIALDGDEALPASASTQASAKRSTSSRTISSSASTSSPPSAANAPVATSQSNPMASASRLSPHGSPSTLRQAPLRHDRCKRCGGEGHDEDECLEEAAKEECKRCGGGDHDKDECLEAGRAHTARAAEEKASAGRVGRKAGEGRVGGASNVSGEWEGRERW